MMKNYYTQDNMGQWRRWDDDLVKQFDHEVRVLVKILAGLVLTALVFVLIRVL
jgi:hypothetical protein